MLKNYLIIYIEIEYNNTNIIQVNYKVNYYNIDDTYTSIILIFSAFLKNEYGINAYMLAQKKNSYNINLKGNYDKYFVLLPMASAIFLGYVVYLGGLMFEKVKERRTCIKHLLILSGCNLWSYWVSYFIIDFLKLIIFNVLLMLPIYLKAETTGGYLWIDSISVCFSSLTFIYFLTFFCEKEDSGTKFILILISILLLPLYLISTILSYASTVNVKLLKIILNLVTIFSNIFFSLTPLTSMTLGYVCVIFKINRLFKEESNINTILIYNCLVQVANFFVYGLFIILYEVGVMKQFIRYLKRRKIKNSECIFSQENASPDFIANNNVDNPILSNRTTQTQMVSINSSSDNIIINNH